LDLVEETCISGLRLILVTLSKERKISIVLGPNQIHGLSNAQVHGVQMLVGPSGSFLFAFFLARRTFIRRPEIVLKIATNTEERTICIASFGSRDPKLVPRPIKIWATESAFDIMVSPHRRLNAIRRALYLQLLAKYKYLAKHS